MSRSHVPIAAWPSLTPLGRYENEDVALNTGTILKELLRYENLARILLYSDEWVSGSLAICGVFTKVERSAIRFYLFLDYIEKTSFGTSCDAFANMKVCPSFVFA